MIRTEGLTVRFGGLTAVSDLNVEINKNEIVGLIGPNGAGKTTAFNAITGVYRPTEGRVLFEQRDVTGMKPHRINGLGVARTFQNIRLFKGMDVLDNVLVGCHQRLGTSFWAATLHLPGYRASDKVERAFAHELLERLGLDAHAKDEATSLPYGKQRRLEIARALATKPKLLLLDEPAAGMNPQESLELMGFIHQMRDAFDLTVLLIEHHMQVVMGVCDRMYVLDYGVTIAKGKPAEIRANPKVIEAYLGVD